MNIRTNSKRRRAHLRRPYRIVARIKRLLMKLNKNSVYGKFGHRQTYHYIKTPCTPNK